MAENISTIEEALQALEQEKSRADNLQIQLESLQKELEDLKSKNTPKENTITPNENSISKRKGARVTIDIPKREIAPPPKPKMELSSNVLVVDENGINLQRLKDVINAVYGEDFVNPYVVQDDDDYCVSLTTARDVFRREENAPKTPSTYERMMDPILAAAYKMVEFLNDYYIQSNDNSFASLFEDENDYNDYGHTIIGICKRAETILATEPLYLTLKSPIYIMGDVHGSFPDLYYFLRELINFNHLSYTANRLLFLGDYVDRGLASVEVAALLLSLKCLSPHSIYMLRGNHETVECNASTTYGDTSLLSNCIQRFGRELGYLVCRAFNSVFSKMPLAADVDNSIFCVHGGIPRPPSGYSYKQCLEILSDMDFPRREDWLRAPKQTDKDNLYRALAIGLLWSDPAPSSTQLDSDGFGPNPSRGPDTYTFGTPALQAFLSETGHCYIIRAHEAKQAGLRLCKNGRVITVFTSSSYCGGDNGAGAVFVDQNKIRLISVLNNSPYARHQLK